MDASIIIVNWNTREILRDCLKAVYEQTKDIAFEVIVVDNASSDRSAEMVKREFRQTVLIENDRNVGFASANNQGITIATGRYVLLLNSDTIVLEGAIQKTVSCADCRPEAAVIGCKVLNSDRTLQSACFMFPSVQNMLLSAVYLYKILPRNRYFGREQMTWWGHDDEREIEVVAGCFMLVRRAAIDMVGVMDDDYFMYGEETDWCWRFRRAGWKNLFWPGAAVVHLGGASSKKMKPQMRLQLSGSTLLFMKKNRGLLSYWSARVITSLYFFLRIPFWIVRSAFSNKYRTEYYATAGTYLQGAVRSLLCPDALLLRKERF